MPAPSERLRARSSAGLLQHDGQLRIPRTAESPRQQVHGDLRLGAVFESPSVNCTVAA